MKRTKTQIGLSLAFAGVLFTNISAFADWGGIRCATYDSSTKKLTVKGCSYKYGTYIKFNGKLCSATYDWSTGNYGATLSSDPEPGSYCVGVGTSDDDEKQTCVPVCQVGAAAVWRDGTGAPASTLGANGDYYLDAATSNVYKKSAGTYAIVANIKGATGPMGLQGLAGPIGPIGATGPAGPKGATGLTGAVGPAGPQGVAGPVGPAGATGATGLTGAAGPKGDTGLTGATGPAGAQGVAGPAGVKGDTGSTGAAGPKGDTGLTGSTGLAGAQGVAGAEGATGSSGAKGDTGAAGPQGPKGDTGAAGTSVKVTSIAVGDVNLPTGGVDIQLVDALNNAIGTPVFVANGAQGPKGDPGSPGKDGVDGVNGAAGPVGPTGATGAVGPMGPQGVAGPKGDNGPTGPQGAAGPTGATGVVGPAGPTGATGAAGPQGVAGPKGATGATGAAGTDGKNGLSYALFSNDSVSYTLPLFAAIPNTSTSKTLTLTPGQWLVKGTATFKNTLSSTTIPWIPLTVTLNGVSVDINNLATVPTVLTTIESARQLISGGPVFPAFCTVTTEGFVNVVAGSPVTVSISVARQAALTGDVSQVLMFGSQISAVQFDSISAQ